MVKLNLALKKDQTIQGQKLLQWEVTKMTKESKLGVTGSFKRIQSFWPRDKRNGMSFSKSRRRFTIALRRIKFK
jgi:hypothetical protein